MARKQQRPNTGPEVVGMPAEAESHAPGGFTATGSLVDRDGVVMSRVQRNLSRGRAQRLIKEGAALAIEPCRCGGDAGCAPEWIVGEALELVRRGETPRIRPRRGESAWIDLWHNENGQVVLAKGAVEWKALTADPNA